MGDSSSQRSSSGTAPHKGRVSFSILPRVNGKISSEGMSDSQVKQARTDETMNRFAAQNSKDVKMLLENGLDPMEVFKVNLPSRKRKATGVAAGSFFSTLPLQLQRLASQFQSAAQFASAYNVGPGGQRPGPEVITAVHPRIANNLYRPGVDISLLRRGPSVTVYRDDPNSPIQQMMKGMSPKSRERRALELFAMPRAQRMRELYGDGAANWMPSAYAGANGFGSEHMGAPSSTQFMNVKSESSSSNCKRQNTADLAYYLEKYYRNNPKLTSGVKGRAGPAVLANYIAKQTDVAGSSSMSDYVESFVRGEPKPSPPPPADDDDEPFDIDQFDMANMMRRRAFED